MTWQTLAAMVDRTAAAPFESDVAYTFDPGGAGEELVNIRGVFDAAGQRAELAGASVITTQPQVGLHLADLPTGAPRADDEVVIDGTTWAVEAWDVDGPGVGVIVWLRDPA